LAIATKDVIGKGVDSSPELAFGNVREWSE
jgi:hypothetical protein